MNVSVPTTSWENGAKSKSRAQNLTTTVKMVRNVLRSRMLSVQTTTVVNAPNFTPV